MVAINYQLVVSRGSVLVERGQIVRSVFRAVLQCLGVALDGFLVPSPAEVFVALVLDGHGLLERVRNLEQLYRRI